jgi:hypothetical protein
MLYNQEDPLHISSSEKYIPPFVIWVSYGRGPNSSSI